MDDLTEIEGEVTDELPNFAPDPKESDFFEREIPREKLEPLQRATSFEDLRNVLPEFVRTIEPRWRLDASELATEICEAAYYRRLRRVLAYLNIA
ncbi:hypothetical protein [Curtobacterium sp. VKM Ac-2922]|uniref:hypothetical protein n=1 Tax=Curtobacterium sp. VKM Ac-2922 TaxID=2929475 RepID=UPI001FB43675|nr:hypothetical protein [Curtobacterium sp. VKM Ac-2922]MCJ1715166.1 hypothetical protein [Curtobacterium sp. VKM Ac-2922]